MKPILKKGFLFVMSGMDGAGKSTQIVQLMKVLSEKGHHPTYLWSRGGYTPIFSLIKTFLRKVACHRLPQPGQKQQRDAYLRSITVRRAWLFLAIIDLIFLYGIRVRIWLLRGYSVVCDRYLMDTLVDFRISFSHDSIEEWLLWRLLKIITPMPDLAFLFMISPELSMKRSLNPDKMEPFPDPLPVREQRWSHYHQIATVMPKITIIDASQPVDAVWSTINNKFNDIIRDGM